MASPRYSWPLLLVTALLFPDLLPEVSSQARSLRVEGELQRAESLTFAALAGPAEDLTAWQAAVDAWEGCGSRTRGRGCWWGWPGPRT